jgi:hypothetical protein
MNPEKVFNYIHRVEDDRNDEKVNEDFKNSLNYKYRILEKGKNDARNYCIGRIFEKFYRDAIPLSDSYKNANQDVLRHDIDCFIADRDADSLAYYIGEARRRGSKPAAKIMESVDNIVDEIYNEKELNIDKVNPDDLVFKSDDDVEKKIDLTSSNLGLKDLSKIISDNVKNTAKSEITRAKKEKDDMKKVEADLANDINVQSEAAIDRELALRGYLDKKVFQPSLFEGVMIGNLHNAEMMESSGANDTVYLYDALNEYGMTKEDGDNPYATPEELAFVESLRDYTLLSCSKALILEDYNNIYKIRQLAQDYAQR